MIRLFWDYQLHEVHILPPDHPTVEFTFIQVEEPNIAQEVKVTLASGAANLAAGVNPQWHSVTILTILK